MSQSNEAGPDTLPSIPKLPPLEIPQSIIGSIEPLQETTNTTGRQSPRGLLSAKSKESFNTAYTSHSRTGTPGPLDEHNRGPTLLSSSASRSRLPSPLLPLSQPSPVGSPETEELYMNSLRRGISSADSLPPSSHATPATPSSHLTIDPHATASGLDLDNGTTVPVDGLHQLRHPPANGSADLPGPSSTSPTILGNTSPSTLNSPQSQTSPISPTSAIARRRPALHPAMSMQSLIPQDGALVRPGPGRARSGTTGSVGYLKKRIQKVRLSAPKYCELINHVVEVPTSISEYSCRWRCQMWQVVGDTENVKTLPPRGRGSPLDWI